MEIPGLRRGHFASGRAVTWRNRNNHLIFSKSYDFLLWLLNHTEKFSKSERCPPGAAAWKRAFFCSDDTLQATWYAASAVVCCRMQTWNWIELRLYVRVSQRSVRCCTAANISTPLNNLPRSG
jgi:hypothetical protein